MNPALPSDVTTPAIEPSTRVRAGLQFFQIVRIAWRAIIANTTRSILTALGVIIGVAAVIALTSLGSGATSGITKQLEGLGTNLLVIAGGNGNRGGGPPGLIRTGGAQTITLKDVEAVKEKFPTRIVALAPTLQRNIQIKYDSANTSATVIGTWPAYATVRNSAVERGAWFTDEDVRGRKRVVVIGYQIVQDLFANTDPLGQKIKLGGVGFTVVGVLPDKGSSGFTSPNSQIMVPLSTYMQRLGRQEFNAQSAGNTVSSVSVQGANKDDLSKLKDEITDLLAVLHKKESVDEYDFNVQNQADALASLNQVTNILTLFLGGVAGISLLVGGIGIMNIMLVSVTERTREIGIRKALGAKPRDVLLQFLIEAVVLSVGGGAIGVLIGLALAFGAGRAVNITPIVGMGSVMLAFCFSAFVGVFFGYYPASRAAKLDPVDSLRYE